MDGKTQGMTEEMKADLKRYLESQGIQNPNMEVTEKDLKKTRDFLRALQKKYGK